MLTLDGGLVARCVRACALLSRNQCVRVVGGIGGLNISPACARVGVSSGSCPALPDLFRADCSDGWMVCDMYTHYEAYEQSSLCNSIDTSTLRLPHRATQGYSVSYGKAENIVF